MTGDKWARREAWLRQVGVATASKGCGQAGVGLQGRGDPLAGLGHHHPWGSVYPASVPPGCPGALELPPAGEGGALGAARAQEHDLGDRDGPGGCWGGDRWAPCPGRDSSAPLGRQEGLAAPRDLT